MSQHALSGYQEADDFSKAQIIALLLSTETGELLQSTDDAIFCCFKKHCSVGADYQALKWNHRFISAFQATQRYLIESGRINRAECVLS